MSSLRTKIQVIPSSQEDSLPDYVYYNVSISNVQNEFGTAPPILSYSQTRDSPYLIKSELYDLSIVRFYLNTSSLPVFCPVIQLNQTDANLTIYSITLTYTDKDTGNYFYSQQYIEYSPQITTIPTPSKVSGSFQDNTNQYYNVYSYTWWIYLVQSAMQSAYNNLSSQLTTAGITIPSSYAPTLSWDTESDCAVLYVPTTGYNDSGDSPTDNILIYFNQPLFNLFSTFPFVVNSYSTSVNGTNMRIAVQSMQQNSILQYPPADPSYNVFVIQQESSTTALMNPVQYMAIQSSSLKVCQTGISAPTTIYNGQTFSNTSTSAVNQPIITDFGGGGADFRPYVLYEPTAEYRWITMQSQGPLNQLDFSIYWCDTLSNAFYPFRLASGGNFSMKILFQKKSIRKGK